MKKIVFKCEPQKLAELSTEELLAALSSHGHGGRFLHEETLYAVRAELAHRTEQTLVEKAGAVVINAAATAGEQDWEYPNALQ